MARKGKEPAGLRRWRLAQKRKNAPKRARRSAPKRTVKRMARRRYSGRKRRVSRKTKTLPIAAAAGTGLFLIDCMDYIKAHPGLTLSQKLINVPIYRGVGYDASTNTWDMADIKGGYALAGGLIASAILPKIPLVRSVPKRIPLVGKYLRW